MKESEKKDKYYDLAREWKKLWNMKVTIVPIVICALGTITKGFLKSLGSWRTRRDYPNDSIAEDSQNTETSPGDLRRLAVTQTPVKNHQLILIWKTLEEYIIIMIIIIIIIAFEEKKIKMSIPDQLIEKNKAKSPAYHFLIIFVFVEPEATNQP